MGPEGGRRTIRLQGYDYRWAGAYFVTIRTYGRMKLFGIIQDNDMHLNGRGRIADEYWRAIPVHFPNAELDAHRRYIVNNVDVHQARDSHD